MLKRLLVQAEESTAKRLQKSKERIEEAKAKPAVEQLFYVPQNEQEKDLVQKINEWLVGFFAEQKELTDTIFLTSMTVVEDVGDEGEEELTLNYGCERLQTERVSFHLSLENIPCMNGYDLESTSLLLAQLGPKSRLELLQQVKSQVEKRVGQMGMVLANWSKLNELMTGQFGEGWAERGLAGEGCEEVLDHMAARIEDTGTEVHVHLGFGSPDLLDYRHFPYICYSTLKSFVRSQSAELKNFLSQTETFCKD